MAALLARVLSAVTHLLIIGPPPLCPKMADPACGRQIVARVFHGEGGELSHACCARLIQFGKKCHDERVELRITSGGYEANATAVLRNSAEVWNGCVSAVLTPAASPSESCGRMRNVQCGKEIVRRVFHLEGRVTPGCCVELLKLGRECHDELVEARILRGGYEGNATAVLRESAKVWTQCALKPIA
ncbi:hypothetical protein MLD38_007790 [Melastoma candidum]|uniref:Uncharacterized protein n=1 Tax=Melastoma candidum TaxID=119954 RepID=A0ACB9RSE0_9MYRT|nr:hypothetical protein MLD38_007790 [Melastoma candidum]